MRLIGLAIFLLLPMVSPDARAERFLGVKPGEQTYSSLAPCTTSLASAHAAVSDSATSAPGTPISGGGTYHVDAVCEATQSGGSYAWAVSGGVGGASPALNVLSLGMKPGGFDNGSLVTTLNDDASRNGGRPASVVVFPEDPSKKTSTYVFSQPLDIWTDSAIKCGDGSRANVNGARVSLVFYPGVPGVRWLNESIAPAMGYGGGSGNSVINLSGCNIYSLGFGLTPPQKVTRGNPAVPVPSMAFPAIIVGGADTTLVAPLFSVGDGVFTYEAGAQEWPFTATVSGTILNVSAVGTPFLGNNGEIGLMAGMALTGKGFPAGSYIAGSGNSLPGGGAATCAGVPCTGIGGAGTYLLNTAVSSITCTSNSCAAHAMHLGPVAPMGTTVVSCQHPHGNQCLYGAGYTMTLSNAPSVGRQLVHYMLPGPNTNSPAGDQHYTATTSTTGHIYGPITANITSGSATLNITDTNSTSPQLGHYVIGISGAPVSANTASNIIVGQYNGISIDCTHISAGMLIVGSNAGNPIFPPGTAVASCTGGVSGKLTVTHGHNSGNGYLAQEPISTTTGTTTSASNVLQFVNARFIPANFMYVGMPITGAGIQANTTVASWTVNPWPYDSWYASMTIVMSRSATATASNVTLAFGGALQAVSSGARLTFLSGSANIIACPGGTCGRRGNYTLKSTAGMTQTGASLYFYDTASTIFVTAGPRPIRPGELLYTDAFPWGVMALDVWGSSPSTRQTIFAGTTDGYQTVNAIASGSSASNCSSHCLWILPTGVYKGGQGNVKNNIILNFPVGVEWVCQGGNSVYPGAGCGRSTDSENFIAYSLMGIWVFGNQSGGSAIMTTELDHNYYCDICDLGTVGIGYTSIQFQCMDESNCTQDLILAATNSSSFFAPYMSGSSWSISGLPTNTGMRSIGGPVVPHGAPYFGAVWGVPADGYGYSNNGVTCSGPPSASFSVLNGIVTHC